MEWNIIFPDHGIRRTFIVTEVRVKNIFCTWSAHEPETRSGNTLDGKDLTCFLNTSLHPVFFSGCIDVGKLNDRLLATDIF